MVDTPSLEVESLSLEVEVEATSLKVDVPSLVGELTATASSLNEGHHRNRNHESQEKCYPKCACSEWSPTG